MTEMEKPNPSYKKAEDSIETGKSEKKKHVEKVVKGKTTVKKKPAAKRAANALLADDAADVKSYLIWDVLVPAVKDTIADLVKKGIDAVLFGGASPSRSVRRDRDRSRVSYSDYYDRSRREREEYRRRSPRNRSRSFDDILFDDRKDAEDVLENLVEILVDYDMASVADFYELAGEETVSDYTDNKYGWTDLKYARVVRTRDGWVVDLPKPRPID